ncbi:unnamed protein product [marine sediment metagenome]|uniref:N-acetyltransferase domain-containing protein n=1 Tax=marine sediment metagenome TaxID=412755 RepID=X0V1N1_9ZZZZ
MPPKLEDLKFVRIIDPQLFAVIPRYLFEQIKELNGEMIDAIRENATNILTVPVMNEKGVVVGTLPKLNVWIAALYDVDLGIKGFLWANFDGIEKCIYVHACSVDKEYQSADGAFINKVVEYLRSLPISEKFKNKILMSTSRPKAFEKRGWNRSKKIFMEFTKITSVEDSNENGN